LEFGVGSLELGVGSLELGVGSLELCHVRLINSNKKTATILETFHSEASLPHM
jgi:hypothetical protein